MNIIFQLADLLPEVCRISFAAGQLISEIYHQADTIDVERKKDGTPVTIADEKADDFIREQLTLLTPNIPLVTEESVAQIPFNERKDWSTYWLVDPLDGTKEFIAGTGEFSVNIALIHQHKPLLGVVFGPEKGNLYFAYRDFDNVGQVGKLAQLSLSLDSAAFNWSAMVKQAPAIEVAPHPEKIQAMGGGLKVAVSRRHGGDIQRFMSQLGHCTTMQMGSALKACLVAEGKADVYPRLGPTSLWDTAASQCIVEMAGGAMLNAAGHPLEYVQTESLLNPFFMVVSHQDYSWPKFPEVF